MGLNAGSEVEVGRALLLPMLVIRLVRTGRRNLAHYRLVVSEKRSKLRGRVVDLLGSYNPHRKAFSGVTREKVEDWVRKGAQVSDTAARLLNKEFGFNFPVKIKTKKPKKKQKEPPTSPASLPQESKDGEPPATETVPVGSGESSAEEESPSSSSDSSAAGEAREKKGESQSNSAPVVDGSGSS